MNSKLWSRSNALSSLVFVVALGLVGCAHPIHTSSAPAPVQAELRFVDVQKFDKELRASLSQPLPEVEVSLFNAVTPNQIPERLQNWLAAVEDGGGVVQVIPPPTDLKPKDPLLKLSLVNTLWSDSKTAKEVASGLLFKSAQQYNAQILLKTDGQGVSVVDRIIFVQRKPPSP
jgi:hypothetical protein